VELTSRVVRLIHQESVGLVAADVSGRVHILDHDLNLVRSSPALRGGQPLYAVAVTEEYVVAKDRLGNLLRWSLPSLDLVDRLDAFHTRDESGLMEGEEPAPVINHGIGIRQGKVFVNNGYLQLVVLDLETFTVERIVPSITGDVAMEWINTDHPDVHVISDKAGRLFLGRLEDLHFPTTARVDTGNVHRVCYDRRHDRFWATQDEGQDETLDVANGIVVIGTDGEVRDRLLFARDDVEFLDFSPDFMTAYAGGFDGVLHVFDNSTPQLRIVRTIEGFSHQLSDFAVGPHGTVFVLTHDGEIVKLDDTGTIVARAPFRRQCVWDIQPSIDDPDLLYCALDDGVAVLRVQRDAATGPVPVPVAHHTTGGGFTRRVVAVPSGWVGITRDRTAFRSDARGGITWRTRTSSLIHTVAVSPDHSRVLLATNDGGFELDALTGTVVDRLAIDGVSVWTSAYTPDGSRVLANRDGAVCSFAPGSAEPAWRLELDDYPKRMWYADGALFVTGGGGVRMIATDGSGVLRHWDEAISNTCENAVVVDGLVCAVSYDMQVLAFDYESGELVGLQEDRPDIPKAVAVMRARDGNPFLLVGGRSGYLATYRLDKGAENGTFGLVRESYLPRLGLTDRRVVE
jgi:outer membrane protein assembly factor BamB